MPNSLYACIFYREKIDNKLFQTGGEINWERESMLQRFGSNEPSSGLSGMILVMLNQRRIFEIQKQTEKQYIWKEVAV